MSKEIQAINWHPTVITSMVRVQQALVVNTQMYCTMFKDAQTFYGQSLIGALKSHRGERLCVLAL